MNHKNIIGKKEEWKLISIQSHKLEHTQETRKIIIIQKDLKLLYRKSFSSFTLCEHDKIFKCALSGN